MAVEYTPIQAIPKIVAASRQNFRSHITQSLEFRIAQLKALGRMCEENAEDLNNALKADLGRSHDFEITTCISVCKSFAENLHKLTQDQIAEGSESKDSCYVRYSPLGTVLLIGAWNFPIMLMVEPLAGAIAAGNTSIVKPSEISQTSAKLLTKLLEKYMDPRIVSVINGAVEETTVLLKERFDHILYTGGSQIAKVIMAAAAKHLTPVTLELGGKCPVIITDKSDLVDAAQKIAGWKTLNCGQVCLSVDYVLCPKAYQEELIKNVIGTWQHLYGADTKTSDKYSRIVSARQHERLVKLLEVVKTQNNIIYGGRTDPDGLYIEPTIVTNVSQNDEIMRDEIFGPILPIIDCESLDDAIDIINRGEHPLSLTVFTDDKDEIEQVLRETRSGAANVNVIAAQFLNHSLPFGGIGNSGLGSYHGKYSIDTFSHKRAVTIRPQHRL